jgi:hypothetical protein
MRLSEPIERVVGLFVQNGLGMAVTLAGAVITFRTWSIPVIGAELDLALLGYLSRVLALLGLSLVTGLVASQMLRRPNILLAGSGRLFVAGTLIMLFSYAVAWHIQASYFTYPRALILVALSILSAAQAAVWDHRSSKIGNPLPELTHSSAWAVPALVVGVLFLLVAVIPSLRTVRFEDTYITLRYGWNLAHGQGITWNALDPLPAEGYTSFLYVLLSALFFAIDIDPLHGLQVFGLFSLLLLSYLTWQLARTIFHDKTGLRSLLPVAILLSLPATAFHVATGMETLFFSSSLALICLLAIKWLEDDSGNPRLMFWLGLAIFVSAETRPEGAIFGLLALSLMAPLSQGRLFRRKNLMALMPSMFFPGAIYVVWHLAYFKSLLPLSFYHKSFVGAPYAHAARSVLFTDFAGMVLLPYLGYVFYGLFSRSLPKVCYVMLAPAALLALYYSKVLPVAGLQYRFFFPFLFAFVVVSSDGWIDLLTRFALRIGMTPMFGVVVIALAFLSLGPFPYETRNNISLLAAGSTYDENTDDYPRVGKALLNIDPGIVIGIGESGKIGMMLRKYTLVDIVGLNDRYLARHPLTSEYLDSRHVDVLVVFQYAGAPTGVYADVYRKVGEAFPQIERDFVCVGNIRGLDVLIRRRPDPFIPALVHALGRSSDFDEGICLSATTARWSAATADLPLSQWTYSQLHLARQAGGLWFEVTGDDPILRSPPLHLNARDYNNVFVTLLIPPPVSCSVFVVYFTRTDAPDESEERSIYVPFDPSDEVQTIVANVRLRPEWRGTITGLRIDPVCGLNEDGSPIGFMIDRVLLH